MSCLCRVVVLALLCCHFARSQNFVRFPNDSGSLQAPQARMGLGMNYLGYLLSFLSAPFDGYRGTPVQTPPLTTLQPISLTLFSALPSDAQTVEIEVKTSPSPATTATTTSPIIMTTASQAASPFPTALPTYFPTGIVTSVGDISSLLIPDAIEESGPSLNTNGGNVCGCLPVASCVNQTTRAGVSVRIVTTPPNGVSCPAGLIYCCSPNTNNLCGLSNVIPGVIPGPGQANLGQYPWSAIILQDDDTYVGGGALLDRTHVLTAAHKVASYGNGSTLKIRLGDWDLSSNAEPVRYVEAKVTGIVNHPRYNAATLLNDASVITLATPVPLLTSPTPQINSICLPRADDAFAGSRCWVAGWGKDQFDGDYQRIIKQVDVPVIEHNDCQNRLRRTRLGSSFVLDGSSFLCAGGEASKDACTGDGGNALACERNGQFYVAGITVGGIQCGLPNVPGLYVNVANYLNWINGLLNPSVGIDPRRKPSS